MRTATFISSFIRRKGEGGGGGTSRNQGLALCNLKAPDVCVFDLMNRNYDFMFSLSPINLSQEGRVKIFRSTGTQKEKMKEVRIRGKREGEGEKQCRERYQQQEGGGGCASFAVERGGKGEKKRHKGKASV